MGVAFDLPARKAGDAMVGMMSIFDLGIEGAERVGDAYNHLSNNMDARANDIINVTERVGGIGDLIGLTAEQVGALGASMLEPQGPPGGRRHRDQMPCSSDWLRQTSSRKNSRRR